MNKIFYGGIFMEEESLRENGIYYPIKIDYYKTEETNEKDIFKYGIEIVKTEYKEENNNIEVNKMYKISNKEQEVDEILNILKTNQVTTISAEDIVSDFLYKF